ncbi:phosphotransferase [Cytobacillus depressus]|uniref:Phosphotransferase n=1 Tax=Cytobacillus depressus TaxID=1602942 RepID=A0A6L3V982_9BACI|nr:phosphotransferase [Cytobacillus depressus]KAB2334515.1 phosphotransferase [Cytobacillus depressus]
MNCIFCTNGGARYVVKSNEPQVLQSEANFLTSYKDLDLLPRLLYVEPSNHYMVYTFIPGSTKYVKQNKQEVLKTLVQGLINHYKAVPNNIGWGWADELTASWQSFLLDRMMEANKILGPYLEKDDYPFMLNLVKSSKMNSTDKEPFLLHGDCGVHNFIFNNGQLSGVIDPTPVIGDPLYDLIYAFCSSPDDLTKETIISAASHLRINESISERLLYEEVLIGLFLRIATCIRHHPRDLDGYLKEWNYWKDIIKET